MTLNVESSCNNDDGKTSISKILDIYIITCIYEGVYVHIYVHDIHTFKITCIHTAMQPCVHVCMRTYMHKY